MAGDWIKFEVATLDKAEVHGIAEAERLEMVYWGKYPLEELR